MYIHTYIHIHTLLHIILHHAGRFEKVQFICLWDYESSATRMDDTVPLLDYRTMLYNYRYTVIYMYLHMYMHTHTYVPRPIYITIPYMYVCISLSLSLYIYIYIYIYNRRAAVPILEHRRAPERRYESSDDNSTATGANVTRVCMHV